MPGILLSIDFQKTLDSLNVDFLKQVLCKLNFDLTFIKRIQLLYTNISSGMINNVFTSNYFNITSGVRQGDPLSRCLLIIAAEIPNASIKQSKSISGIRFILTELKILQHAFDIIGILRDIESARNFLDEISTFGFFPDIFSVQSLTNAQESFKLVF